MDREYAYQLGKAFKLGIAYAKGKQHRLVNDSKLALDDPKRITVHPNGKENKGQPALLDSEGMGGKFNGKHISAVPEHGKYEQMGAQMRVNAKNHKADLMNGQTIPSKNIGKNYGLYKQFAIENHPELDVKYQNAIALFREINKENGTNLSMGSYSSGLLNSVAELNRAEENIKKYTDKDGKPLRGYTKEAREAISKRDEYLQKVKERLEVAEKNLKSTKEANDLYNKTRQQAQERLEREANVELKRQQFLKEYEKENAEKTKQVEQKIRADLLKETANKPEFKQYSASELKQKSNEELRAIRDDYTSKIAQMNDQIKHLDYLAENEISRHEDPKYLNKIDSLKKELTDHMSAINKADTEILKESNKRYQEERAKRDPNYRNALERAKANNQPAENNQQSITNADFKKYHLPLNQLSKIEKETDKAFLISSDFASGFDGDDTVFQKKSVWVPKSQVSSKNGYVFGMNPKFAKENGFTTQRSRELAKRLHLPSLENQQNSSQTRTQNKALNTAKENGSVASVLNVPDASKWNNKIYNYRNGEKAVFINNQKIILNDDQYNQLKKLAGK